MDIKGHIVISISSVGMVPTSVFAKMFYCFIYQNDQSKCNPQNMVSLVGNEDFIQGFFGWCNSPQVFVLGIAYV